VQNSTHVALKSKQQLTSNYEGLIDRLFEIPMVRYAVVIDELGNRFCGGMKPGVKSTTPLGVEKRLEMQAALILKMAEGYERFDGDLYYCSIHWKKVSAYFFLVGNGNQMLTLTIEPKAPPSTLARVRTTVLKWKK
jgi:hypothetical protein